MDENIKEVIASKGIELVLNKVLWEYRDVCINYFKLNEMIKTSIEEISEKQLEMLKDQEKIMKELVLILEKRINNFLGL